MAAPTVTRSKGAVPGVVASLLPGGVSTARPPAVGKPSEPDVLRLVATSAGPRRSYARWGLESAPTSPYSGCLEAEDPTMTLTTRPTWIDDVLAHGVQAVAEGLGLAVSDRPGHGAGPCPACGAETRHPSRRDRRGAIGFRPDGCGWRCHQCDTAGDGVDLVAFSTLGKRPAAGDREAWRQVRARAAAAGLCERSDGRANIPQSRPLPSPVAIAAALKRPPADEVAALWNSARPVTTAHPRCAGVPEAARDADAALALFLARRGLHPADLAPLDVARALPLAGEYDFPAWWPSRWTATWRLAVAAYEADGTLASLHARGVLPEAEPKTRWPLGHAAGELLLADPGGLAVLRSQPAPSLEAVWLAEGLTDLLALALEAQARGSRWAVLAATSGGFRALARVRWPAGVVALVATDGDAQGNKYAAEIRAALPPTVDVRRTDLLGAASKLRKAAT